MASGKLLCIGDILPYFFYSLSIIFDPPAPISIYIYIFTSQLHNDVQVHLFCNNVLIISFCSGVSLFVRVVNFLSFDQYL